MQLDSLHILLTYRCTLECDHCFVWGAPRQEGVLSIEEILNVLHQARSAGVRSVYFEGGEPFLYYAGLVRGVRAASELGFSVGIVTNAYWAITVADAAAYLEPFEGCLGELTVSSDLFHCEKCLGEEPQNAIAAAKWLHIPTNMISIPPGDLEAGGQRAVPSGEAAVMYRGRAAQFLARGHATKPWRVLTSCEHEDLRDPGRVHVDPLGNVHICQGIVIGNLFERPLKELCESYDPGRHPICRPLLAGGPAALVAEFGIRHRLRYADCCHLCYEARVALRPRFPTALGPDQMYGVMK